MTGLPADSEEEARASQPFLPPCYSLPTLRAWEEEPRSRGGHPAQRATHAPAVG